MKIKIQNDAVLDTFIVSGDTIQECRTKVFEEMAKRGWEAKDCWSEDVS